MVNQAQAIADEYYTKHNHKTIVQQAIAEGKITEHPDYPELSEPKEIFIRAAEKRDLARVQKSLKEIPDKFGYEKVYKRDGKQGRGFYYNKVKVKEVKPEKPAPSPSGAENLVTFLTRAGKVRLGEEFQDKTGDSWSRAHGFRSKDRSRELGDIAAVTSKNGKMAMDEAATFVNAEGFRDKNGDKFTDRSLYEILASGEGRNILHPDIEESKINRELERKAHESAIEQEQEYLDRQREALAEQGIDAAREIEENSESVRADLISEIAEEGNLTEEQLEAAYEEVSSFFDEMSKEPRTETKAGKQSWEQTRDEYVGNKTGDARAVALSAHALHVKQAVADGEKVPLNVLNNYKSNGWAQIAIDKIKSKGDVQTTIPGASEAETFSLTAKEPETPVVKGAKLTPKNLQPKEKVEDMFAEGQPEIKEWQDIPELDAQIRTIEKPTKDFDKWTVQIGVQESLGERGGDILTQFYKDKPTLQDIKDDIIQHYKDEKIKINKEVVPGITAKSGREEIVEEAIDKVLETNKPESATADSGEELTPTTDTEYTPAKNLIHHDVAMRSHHGTSFDPEKRGQQEIEGFYQELTDIYDKLKGQAKSEEAKKCLFLK